MDHSFILMIYTLKCFSACRTQLYSLLVTNAKYPTPTTFKHTKEFCFVVKKLLRSFESRRVVWESKQPKLFELLSKLKVCIVTFTVTLPYLFTPAHTYYIRERTKKTSVQRQTTSGIAAVLSKIKPTPMISKNMSSSMPRTT